MNKRIKCIFLKKTIWGEKGEIEWLSSGFVRNFALPQEIVSIYSERNFKLITKETKKAKEKLDVCARQKNGWLLLDVIKVRPHGDSAGTIGQSVLGWSILGTFLGDLLALNHVF